MFCSDAPRILIARLSAIGDTILTLPVACALRRHFPQAYIAWVVERKSCPVVLRHECLDDVFVLERGWFTKPQGLLATRRLLRSHAFDISIDCQGMTKSALAGWLSGARQRVGLRGEHGRELSPWLNNVLVRPQKPHVIDRSLELLSPLGVRNPRVQWRFPADDQARQTMQQAVRALGLRSGYAVINPGATWDSRLWETSRFGAVARYLGQQHELPTLVVWGSDRERHWAEEIVAHSGGHARLAPPTNLMELAALIQGGRLFISPDTGPLHIAVAVGTPSISLHGPTRAEVSGAYGPQHATIQVHYQPGSHKQRRQADNSAMRMITVDMVCQHCTALLARTRASIQRDAA